MDLKELFKWIEEIETADIDTEVWKEIKNSGAFSPEDWASWSGLEKAEQISHLEVYDWQDYYAGFYSATDMIKREILNHLAKKV